MIHDNVILSYTVDLQLDRIVIHTRDESTLKEVDIVLKDVCCHYFEHQVKGSIILAMTVSNISSFIAGNIEILRNGKDHGWPTVYESIDELEKKLTEGGYKYFNLYSSYGMSGWIVAKDLEVVKKGEEE
ncbi:MULTISPECIES: hypothetical protein [unclassified Paenibacillus]|uniref:hypothetical protein n=1 Tax=unclassified Paenibacillus TaxID=185978 RepID=UPI001053DA4C|nr:MULTISPECIES: hypothetical protein [unclassified Paenibacillus]NIK70539.1 hypothetical protein [Paenibacillus sp. BK720]TCM91038.1 hypothetical protein EV294_109115 [Paenibacillus sp. BK033]